MAFVFGVTHCSPASNPVGFSTHSSSCTASSIDRVGPYHNTARRTPSSHPSSITAAACHSNSCRNDYSLRRAVAYPLRTAPRKPRGQWYPVSRLWTDSYREVGVWRSGSRMPHLRERFEPTKWATPPLSWLNWLWDCFQLSIKRLRWPYVQSP